MIVEKRQSFGPKQKQNKGFPFGLINLRKNFLLYLKHKHGLAFLASHYSLKIPTIRFLV